MQLDQSPQKAEVSRDWTSLFIQNVLPERQSAYGAKVWTTSHNNE